MSEEQIQQLNENIKDLSLEIKLVWQKLNDIQVTIAGQGVTMKHSAKDIDKHIEESNIWRRAILATFMASIFSVISAVGVFFTLRSDLNNHIEYSERTLKRIVQHVNDYNNER